VVEHPYGPDGERDTIIQRKKETRYRKPRRFREIVLLARTAKRKRDVG